MLHIHGQRNTGSVKFSSWTACGKEAIGTTIDEATDIGTMVCTGVGIDLIDGGDTGIVAVVGPDVVDEEDEVCGVIVTDVSNVDETELVVDDVLDSGDVTVDVDSRDDVVELVEEDEEDTAVGNVKGVTDVDDVVDDSFVVVCVEVCVVDVVKLGVDAEVVLTVVVTVKVDVAAGDVVV